MSNANRVFYLIPRRRRYGEVVDLFLPRDLVAQEDGQTLPSLGFGVFAFLRSARHRGKPRQLSFPAVFGFGENSLEVELKLQSDYLRAGTGSGSRFSFVQDGATQGGDIDTSFVARKFPPNFRLAGTAASLAGYNLWALIPENREYLEMLWIEREFYLIGHGTIGDDRDSLIG